MILPTVAVGQAGSLLPLLDAQRVPLHLVGSEVLLQQLYHPVDRISIEVKQAVRMRVYNRGL
jgi:hypothetical protein